MAWRDGHFPEIDSGRKTVHELRQEHLPTSKIAKAFTHGAGAPRQNRQRLIRNLADARRVVAT